MNITLSPVGTAADYTRGWDAANRGSSTALERADSRGETSRWYDGYYDRAAGRSRGTTVRDAAGNIVRYL